MIEIVLDIVLVALLVATIVYAAMLSRRLAHLRQGRAEMDKTIADFDGATARAEDGIKRLKSHAAKLGGDLDRRMQSAQALRDELAFLIECAEERAEELGGAIRAHRAVDRTRAGRASEVGAPTGAGAGRAKSGPEAELLETLKNLR